MTVTVLVLVVSVALFVLDRLPADVVAIGAMLTLYLTDTLDLQEALAGFSDPSVVLIAALFVVTARDGYSGPIRLLIGVSADGTVNRARVLEHRETPGLGANPARMLGALVQLVGAATRRGKRA